MRNLFRRTLTLHLHLGGLILAILNLKPTKATQTTILCLQASNAADPRQLRLRMSLEGIACGLSDGAEALLPALVLEAQVEVLAALVLDQREVVRALGVQRRGVLRRERSQLVQRQRDPVLVLRQQCLQCAVLRL